MRLVTLSLLLFSLFFTHCARPWPARSHVPQEFLADDAYGPSYSNSDLQDNRGRLLPRYLMSSYPHMFIEPVYWRNPPPSPFIQAKVQRRSHYSREEDDSKRFTRKPRNSEESENAEDYYNEWILSNYGKK